MGIKLGRGFAHKLGDASAVIRRQKSKKPKPVSRAKATTAKASRP